MAEVELDAQPLQAYAALEKAGDVRLLDAIDDALDILEADPVTQVPGAGLLAAAGGESRSMTAPRTG